MVKKILIGFAVVLAALLLVIQTRPEVYHVERRAAMKAPPEKIFPLIQDFHQWARWSPWEKLDPQMKKTYSAPPPGIGSTFDWAGNKEAGKGRMTIAALEPPNKIAIKLAFLEPFESQSDIGFYIASAPGGSNVTWSMDGRNNFMGKAFSLFANMDAMIGKDFEAGLNNLKALAEKEAAAPK